MRVVIATEGDLELQVLKQILNQVGDRSPTVSVATLKIACQPDGPARLIARKVAPLLRIAHDKRAAKFILVLDREKRPEAPGAIAIQIEQEINRAGACDLQVSVVIKDRTIENWLIADLNALKRLRGRFSVSKKLIAQVAPNKADGVEALSLLKSAALGRAYDKMSDGARIGRELDAIRAGANSRSLRHFLHVLGCPPYEAQCTMPAEPATPRKGGKS